LTEELVDVVDLVDNPTGVRPLAECKRRGLLHRAIAVLLFDASGRLLLQKRSANKDWMAGYWDLSSTGHVKAGESYAQAAIRELGEELGVHSGLLFVTKFLAPKFSQEGLTEWEHISIYEGEHEGEVAPDGVEVDDARFFPMTVVLKMAAPQNPQLTPDAIATLSEFRRVSKRF
jgi:isopentenyl-diphosphate delta-isomerase type 1